MAINYAFPMEGMMGPSTPIDRITAGSSMFGTGGPTPGEQVVRGEANDKYFRELLTKLRAAGPEAAALLGGATKYGAATLPGAANVVGGIANQNVGQALTGGAQIAAGAGAVRASAPLGQAVTRAAAALPGPAKLAAPLIGGATQALVGGLAAGGVGLLAQAPGALARTITGQEQRSREEGKTPGLIPGTGTGVGLDAASQKELEMIRALMNAGVQSNVAGAQAMLPIAKEYLDVQKMNQMQLNQQMGQLTGALNRQQYAFQLAGGAQSEAGANLRTMMASNPYASSAFRA